MPFRRGLATAPLIPPKEWRVLHTSIEAQLLKHRTRVADDGTVLKDIKPGNVVKRTLSAKNCARRHQD